MASMPARAAHAKGITDGATTTSITNGMTLTGGIRIIPDGCGSIIRNGRTLSPMRRTDGDWDDHHHWHDRDWWCTNTIRNGSRSITRIGSAGMTTTTTVMVTAS